MTGLVDISSIMPNVHNIWSAIELIAYEGFTVGSQPVTKPRTF